MKPRSHLTSRQSKRFIERKKVRFTFTALLLLIILGTGGFSFVRLMNLNIFSIQRVYVNGADKDIAPKVQAAALEAIRGDYWGLFDRSNTFLYPSGSVKNAAENASPRVATIAVHRSGLQALTITVSEKTPAALVCANLPDFIGNALSYGDSDDCYFADDLGLIYAHAPSFSGDAYNRYYIPSLTDDSASTTVVGEFATSSKEFTALQGIFSQLKAESILASAVLVKDGGEYELYVHNPNPKPNDQKALDTSTSSSSDTNSIDSDIAVIYFNNARPFADELVNLVSFWNKMAESAKSKHEPLSFDYIDVRYGSNVFYRLSK